MMENAIDKFFSNGGKIKKCKPGTPKDLKRIKRSGWQFGGKRCFINTLAQRQTQSNADGDMFDVGGLKRPRFKGRKKFL